MPVISPVHLTVNEAPGPAGPARPPGLRPGDRAPDSKILYNASVPKASRLDWKILLSHSDTDDLHRCILVSFGAARIHFCARCLGLYPSLLVGTAARLAGLELPEPADVALGLILPLVGASAWGLEQIKPVGPNFFRVSSGVLLGLGLGWVLGLHLREPWPPEMVRLGLGLAAVLVLGLIARWLAASSTASEPFELPPPEPTGEGEHEHELGGISRGSASSSEVQSRTLASKMK